VVKFKPKLKRLIGEESSKMSVSSDLLNAPKEFLQLFKAGKDAARQGNKSKAHALFRQAVEVDPYHEMVWLWLATVVDTDEDRRVCFENVLELNPTNLTARRQLQRLEQKALIEVMHPDIHRQKEIPRWQKIIRLALMFLITVIILVTAWWAIFA
jgi:thioredoxin-like negative regulator of GroEL